jgi:hypothetical protein
MVEYDPDRLFSAAAALAARGWKIVRLYGVTSTGKCTCSKGVDCSTPGKHPSGGVGWQHRATDREEEIEAFFHGDGRQHEHERINIGVRLGPSSGIVDLEYDDSRGEEDIRRWGLDQIDTPAYTSGRGIHRIFRYDESWMPAGTAVLKAGSIEVRLGGGDRALQSVVPPSIHHSGRQYQWLPGRSPDDVAPAPIPQQFRDELLRLNTGKATSGAIARARRVITNGELVTAGGRHDFLVGTASHHAQRCRHFNEQEFLMVYKTLVACNAVHCSPPKDLDEVLQVCRSQFEHYRNLREARRQANPYERWGLEWDADARSYTPGQWRATIVRSNPPVYQLRLPNTEVSGGPMHVVTLTVEEWNNARLTANAVQQVAPRITLLDPSSARWNAVWSGMSIKDDLGNYTDVRGIAGILAEEADEEAAPSEYSILARHAGVLLAYLRGFTASEEGETEEDRQPNTNGVPKWIRDAETGEWALWLRWHETIDGAERRHGSITIDNADRRSLAEEICRRSGLKKFPEARGPKTQKPRHRYWLFTKPIMAAIHSLIGESEEDA